MGHYFQSSVEKKLLQTCFYNYSLNISEKTIIGLLFKPVFLEHTTPLLASVFLCILISALEKFVFSPEHISLLSLLSHLSK